MIELLILFDTLIISCICF